MEGLISFKGSNMFGSVLCIYSRNVNFQIYFFNSDLSHISVLQVLRKCTCISHTVWLLVYFGVFHQNFFIYFFKKYNWWTVV